MLAWAAAYTSEAAVGAPGALAAAGAPAATTAVAYALAQLGTPYLWGGESPAGFDCSGLVQAAYAPPGSPSPASRRPSTTPARTSPPAQPLEPGDLVFFGSDASNVDHVGIVVSQSEMVDAPHTGALVRTEPFDWPDYLGATRPAS